MTIDKRVEQALLEEADKLTAIECKQHDVTDKLLVEQRRIDAERAEMADEVVADRASRRSRRAGGSRRRGS